VRNKFYDGVETFQINQSSFLCADVFGDVTADSLWQACKLL